jgi:hypothetical protein
MTRYSPISIVEFDLPTGHFYRVRVGRLPSEGAARRMAEELRSYGQLTMFVVRLDE